VKIVLPVVAETRGNRQVRSDLNLVLREHPEHPFEERLVAVALLLDEGVRQAGLVL
jgi:hypothetical protein